MKLARQKLSKHYTGVTPKPGKLLISANILDPFRMLRWFRMCDKGMDIDPEDETSYTTPCQEAFLKYVENENCTKQQRVPENELETIPSSNLSLSATGSVFYQSFFDPYDSSSDDQK